MHDCPHRVTGWFLGLTINHPNRLTLLFCSVAPPIPPTECRVFLNVPLSIEWNLEIILD